MTADGYPPSARFNEYVRARRSIDDWVADAQWKATLRADIWLSPQLLSDVVAVTAELNKADIDVSRVDAILRDLRAKSKAALASAGQQHNPNERWRTMRVAYGYYALGECVTEASLYSEAVIEQLRKTLGDAFLEELARFDRHNPSTLTEIPSLQSAPEDPIASSRPEFAAYALLKHWQDDQHVYHENELFPLFKQARIGFKSWLHENLPNLANCNPTQALIAYEGFYRDAPLPVDAVIPYLQVGVLTDSTLRAVMGGKALGIVKLRTVGADVPPAWVVPACAVEPPRYIPTDLPSGPWAARSSATLEDGEKTSFAGIFESVLRVEPENIKEACSTVFASAFSERAQKYAAEMKTDRPHMACVIQRFIEPESAGVWLGSGDGGGTLEWVEGDGEKLVSGRVTPKTEQWLSNAPPQNPWCVGAVAVGAACLKMEEALQSAGADFEFCVDKDKILWLQFRSVTRPVPLQDTSTASTSQHELRGRPASFGEAEGVASVLETPDDKMEDGNILVCEVTDPDWLPVLTRASAIITAEGGVLCHAAITARELGKPCVVGLGPDVLQLDHKRVRVDGTRGRVLIL